MFTLYGFDFSVPVNKVRYVANYGGIDFDYVKRNPAEGELVSEEHLRLHPAGKVPVVEIDGFVLFESNAIIRYLSRTRDLSLYPEDARAQARVDQWLDFVSIHVGNGMNRVFGNHIIFPMFGMEVDERSKEDGRGFLKRFLPVVNEQLKKAEYLCGDALTIADINLIATLDPAELAEVDIGEYAELDVYRKRLIAQEFYQKCFAAYRDCFAAMSG
jgi:glutathione S-transferase